MNIKKGKKNILIIGAGVHGVTVALELAKQNNIILIDANDSILNGASSNNHNRIHLGYHYPRSTDTIKECKLGYNFYINQYKDCLVFPDFFYAISKKSKINSKRFKKIMTQEGLECNSSWPDSVFLNKNIIEESFKANEACIDIQKFRKKIKKRLYNLDVKTILNFKIDSIKKISKNKITLLAKKKKITLNVDVIINCTYTYTNNLLKIFGIKDNVTEYTYEETEIVVVESKVKLPALTVMDGPYISILPRAGYTNQYLVYDVVNSVVNKKVGLFFKEKRKKTSNWNAMRRHGLKYYPFFNNLKYVCSLYANRPIPRNIKGDSRATRITKHKFDIDFFSIKEGKLISAPYIAMVFREIINNE